jgi:hypothetical protein
LFQVFTIKPDWIFFSLRSLRKSQSGFDPYTEALPRASSPEPKNQKDPEMGSGVFGVMGSGAVV